MLDRVLTAEKTKHQTISWSQYCEHAIGCSIPEENIPVVTTFLHDVGTLMHYDAKESGLDQIVILDPQWLADIMASLISFKHQWVKTGILTRELLPQVWKQYPEEIYDSLLGLLTKFEVAVELKGEENFYVIPTLLPEEIPPELADKNLWHALPKENEYQFGRVYEFSFDFDFSKVIARIFSLKHIDVELFWKNGMIMKIGDNDDDIERAYIEWKPKGSRLIFQARVNRDIFDNHKLIFLNLIVDMVESILESFYPGIQGKVKRLIPCCHCVEIGDILLGPYYFTYEECVTAVTNGQSFVYCRGVPTRPVNICYLAPDVAFKDFAIIDPSELEITNLVGSGAFGLVYKGKYANMDVAIKELKAEESESKADELDKFKEFQREVGIMSGLNHTNLVRLFGITIKPHLRMIMEWCPESDLYHFLLSDEPIDWKLRIRICLDIAKGMRYLQDVTPPIIHRDLRSPNVFMMSKNPSAFVVAKVADFGLSLRVEHRVGGFLPTWRWLAPEVIDVDNVYYDETADIYSFAIVMWEIVARDVPFLEYDKDIRQMQIKQMIIHENLRPTIPDDCPPKLARLMKKCWRADPKQRPNFDKSVKELNRLLKSYYPKDNSLPREKKPSINQLPIILSSRHPLNNDLHKRSSLSKYNSTHTMENFSPKSEGTTGIYAMILVGTRIWTGHSDGYITIWDVTLRTQVHSFKAHESRVLELILVEGYVWSSADHIKIWDCRTFEQEIALKEPHKDIIRNLEWVSVSPDESYVWSGDINGVICIWDIRVCLLFLLKNYFYLFYF